MVRGQKQRETGKLAVPASSPDLQIKSGENKHGGQEKQQLLLLREQKGIQVKPNRSQMPERVGNVATKAFPPRSPYQFQRLMLRIICAVQYMCNV